MPDGVARLEALGVQVPADQARPFFGIRYVDGDLKLEGRFGGRGGLGIRRPRLHQALVARAQEVGVELGWGTKVEGLVPGREGRWEVRADGGVWQPEWVVAADGLRSSLRRWAGLAAKVEEGAHRRFGVRRHYAMAPWTDLVEVHWSRGRGEAYVTPVGPREVGVAVLWSGGREGMDALLQGFPELCERLRGAVPVSPDRGAGPLRQRVRGVHRGRLALVGDASGYVDALTGEGLALAFHQASALAAALAAGDLRRYARAHRRLGRVPELVTHLTLVLSRHPALRRRAIVAFQRDPDLFHRLLAVHSRGASVRSLGRVAVLRFLASLLRPGLRPQGLSGSSP